MQAEDFQAVCQDVFDYCAGAEYSLRKLTVLADGDDPEEASGEGGKALSQTVQLTSAATAGLVAQEARVCDCLASGNRILADCQPEAAQRIKQWMHAVNTRWEEVMHAV